MDGPICYRHGPHDEQVPAAYVTFLLGKPAFLQGRGQQPQPAIHLFSSTVSPPAQVDLLLTQCRRFGLLRAPAEPTSERPPHRVHRSSPVNPRRDFCQYYGDSHGGGPRAGQLASIRGPSAPVSLLSYRGRRKRHLPLVQSTSTRHKADRQPLSALAYALDDLTDFPTLRCRCCHSFAHSPDICYSIASRPDLHIIWTSLEISATGTCDLSRRVHRGRDEPRAGTTAFTVIADDLAYN